MAFPEMRELVGWNERRSQSGGAGWKGEQQVMTMASLRAAVGIRGEMGGRTFRRRVSFSHSHSM